MKKRKPENDDKKRVKDLEAVEKKEAAAGKKPSENDDDNSFEI